MQSFKNEDVIIDDFFTFRPDLADQHKVGFFGLDRGSQTNVTEIVDLKEMTEVLQILLQVLSINI